jgi:DNA-binding NtrC family response regulator
MRRRLLIVDDDESVLRYLRLFFLQKGTYEVETVADSTRALRTVAEFEPDLLLLDMHMPEVSGIDVLASLSERATRPEVVVLSGVEDVNLAVRAMKLGAYDYLTKPLDADKVSLTVSRALERTSLKREIAELRRRLEGAGGGDAFAAIVTRAPQMLEVFRYVEIIAPTSNAVLLWGESGTGKELLARAIHRLSKRHAGPFVAVNAAVFGAELFASEFFGHTRGAFTGALGDKGGIVEKANGGTLFLDEIGELSLPIQVKLLRVLQEGEYSRVGSTESRSVDVRLLTATNKDLREEIDRGNFRSDLFYRLDVCSVHIPPLRERDGDIPFLAQYFVEKYAALHGRPVRGISDEVLQILEHHDYKGNVRELENLINSAVLMEPGRQLSRVALPAPLVDAVAAVRARPRPREQPDGGDGERSLEEVEREHIGRVLGRAGGNRTVAAKVLGISRVTLISKIKRYGIHA